MMDLGRLEPLLRSIAQGLRSQGWRIGTAESCTGGLIAAACTALPGSSDWFERSVVSYSNEAKTDLLGVPPALIGEHGAVSEAVARAMAEGLLARAPVQFALAVTGIAGPGGAVPGKPVGTVWLALASRLPALPTTAWRLQLDGDRGAVRARTVELGLQRLLDAVERAAQGVGRSTGSSEG